MGRWLLILTLAFCPSLFALNGAMQIGYGVKSKGMGGLGIAFPQDAFVSALNPAGLVWLGSRAELALHWIQLDQRLSEEDLTYSTVEDIWLPEGALSWRFLGCQSFGFAAYAFGALDTRYDVSIPTFGVEHRSGFEWKMYLFMPSWSWRIAPCFSVGAAINVAYTWISVKGLEEFADSAISVAPAYVTNRGTDHEEGVSVRVGALFRTACISFGITYQTRTWLNAFKRYKGFLPDHGDLRMPSQWGVGVAWTPACALVFSLDVLRVNWTDSKGFAHDVHNKGLFGSWDGPGFGWNDQTVVKAGVAWSPHRCLSLRAGWNYGEVPFCCEDVRLNVLTAAVVKTHYTVGATWVSGCHELSVYALRGSDHAVGDEFFRLSASSCAAGGSYAWRF